MLYYFTFFKRVDFNFKILFYFYRYLGFLIVWDYNYEKVFGVCIIIKFRYFFRVGLFFYYLLFLKCLLVKILLFFEV